MSVACFVSLTRERLHGLTFFLTQITLLFRLLCGAGLTLPFPLVLLWDRTLGEIAAGRSRSGRGWINPPKKIGRQ
jgi:hypothetical protein